jgi:superfamily I DNA/RNA helicase
MDFAPGSEQQHAIWDFLMTGAENGVVEARAGSGKTYTITNGVQLIRGQKQIGVLSFNTHIIREMTDRLSAMGMTWVTARTYNSLGRRAVMKTFVHVYRELKLRLLPHLTRSRFQFVPAA